MLELKTIKKHLNIDETYTADDNYIMQLCDVCYDAVERHINSNINELIHEETNEFPPSINHAVLLLIANYYANRESVVYASVNEIPTSYNYLLDFFKHY